MSLPSASRSPESLRFSSLSFRGFSLPRISPPSFVSWQSHWASAPSLPMLLPGYIAYTLSPFLAALNTTLLHFPLSFSFCLLSMQQFSSALFFDFNSRHYFIFTVSHVSLCWAIQSFCWRVPRLPSVFSRHYSFSSAYTKAYCLAVIFISHILRTLMQCSSCINNDHVSFSFIPKVLFSLMLCHSVFPQFPGHQYLSVFVSPLFPHFFFPFSFYLKDCCSFSTCFTLHPYHPRAVFPHCKFVLSIFSSSSFLVK